MGLTYFKQTKVLVVKPSRFTLGMWLLAMTATDIHDTRNNSHILQKNHLVQKGYIN